MKSVRLYQNTTLKVGTKIDLDESATHHLIKVLRFPEGKNITLLMAIASIIWSKLLTPKKPARLKCFLVKKITENLC
jgi:16S rRNA (uracil1498-N3)-methyltransferase